MSECVLWTGHHDDKGYGRRWTPMVKGKRKQVLAHRYVMAEHAGWDAIAGKNVNHHCDVRDCINIEHLYIGTQKENLADMHRRGRWSADHRGERNGRSKLTDKNVRRIRRLYAKGGMRQVDLAERFGVSQFIVSAVVRRQIWRHVE